MLCRKRDFTAACRGPKAAEQRRKRADLPGPRDRGQTNLHADLVVVLSERLLPPQVTHDELRVPLALEIRQPHVVDAPVLDLGRLDFGRITRIAQRFAYVQRVAERLA